MFGQAPSWARGAAAASQRVRAQWDGAGWMEDRASGAVSFTPTMAPSSCWRSPAQLQPYRCPIHSRGKQCQPGGLSPWDGGHCATAPALSRSVCSHKISTFGCRDFQGSENAVPIIKHLLGICLSPCLDVAPALIVPSLSPGKQSGQHSLLRALSWP